MDLKNKLLQSIHNQKYFIFMFVFFLIVYLYSTIQQSDHQKPMEALSVDTLIPAGYTLVPVELQNIEAISSLIDGYGVVDIYAGKNKLGQPKKILQKVKILRAPNNPHAYSVLVPDRISSILLNSDGPFFAVIQNKSESSANPEVIRPSGKQTNVKIEYNGGQ